MRITVLIVLAAISLSAPSKAQSAGAPDARRTAVAAMREQRETDPVAYATARAERRGEQGARDARPVTVHGPLPLPVLVGGAPLGGACPKETACTLRATAPEQQVVVVTSVWGASTVRCDDVALATPPGGVPIAPWWRCTRELVIEGPGAGYAAFLATR